MAEPGLLPYIFLAIYYSGCIKIWRRCSAWKLWVPGSCIWWWSWGTRAPGSRGCCQLIIGRMLLVCWCKSIHHLPWRDACWVERGGRKYLPSEWSNSWSSFAFCKGVFVAVVHPILQGGRGGYLYKTLLVLFSTGFCCFIIRYKNGKGVIFPPYPVHSNFNCMGVSDFAYLVMNVQFFRKFGALGFFRFMSQEVVNVVVT